MNLRKCLVVRIQVRYVKVDIKHAKMPYTVKTISIQNEYCYDKFVYGIYIFL